MDDAIDTEQPNGPWLSPRRKLGFGILVVLLLAFLLPPWININRFKRNIAASISSSLGRPVRMDHVGLRLLPSPGFTMDNFVVGEDPAFGAEPVVRATTVTATLHISSLWRGRLEFASIDLDEPSVDLVRNQYRAWNLQGILFQAARIATAPTGQRSASSLPRFPYIQAENARVNIKMGDEKLPLSFTDAKLALWLSAPGHWQVEIEGRPIRSDLQLSDTGTLRIEGGLQAAPSLAAIPIDLRLEWEKAQLGEATRLLTGSDLGWRGALETTGQVSGTVGDAHLQLRAAVTGLRREEFFPEKSLDLSVDCSAASKGDFTALSGIHCALPLDTGGLQLEGSVDALKTRPAPQLDLAIHQVPAQTLLAALRHASNRIAPGITAEGSLDGAFHYGPPPAVEDTSSKPGISRANPAKVHDRPGGSAARWQGQAALPHLALNAPGWTHPLVVEDLRLVAGEGAPGPAKKPGGRRSSAPPTSVADNADNGSEDQSGLSLVAASLPLAAAQPAVLTARFVSDGYTFHIVGDAAIARLLELDGTLHLLDSALPALQPTGTASLNVDLHGPWLVPSQETLALLPDAVRPPQTLSLTGELQLKSALLRPAFAGLGASGSESPPLVGATDSPSSPGQGAAHAQDGRSATAATPPGDIGVASAHLVVSTDVVAWQGIVATYNGLRFQGDVFVPTSCTVAQLSLGRPANATAQAPSPLCVASFDLATPTVDFGSVAEALNRTAPQRRSLLDLFSSGPAAAPLLPTAQGTLRVATLDLGPMVVRNAVVRLSTQGSRATLDSFTGDVLGGTIVAHGSVLAGGAVPSYEVDAAIHNFSLAAAATIFHQKWGTGAGEAHCALRLSGADSAVLRHSAAGDCDWQLRRGSLSVSSLGVGPGSHRTSYPFQQWQGNASLANAVLKLEPGEVVSAQGSLPVAGTIGLDRSIDLQWGGEHLQGWLDGADAPSGKTSGQDLGAGRSPSPETGIPSGHRP